MITLQGVDVEAKPVSKRKVESIWRGLTSNPCPKVIVLRVKDDDFNRFLKITRCPGDTWREICEWGRALSTEGTDACVYKTDEFSDVDYFILIRDRPYHSFNAILKHELSHIARGDL